MKVTLEIDVDNWIKFLELTKDVRGDQSGQALLANEFDTPDVLVEMLGYNNS